MLNPDTPGAILVQMPADPATQDPIVTVGGEPVTVERTSPTTWNMRLTFVDADGEEHVFEQEIVYVETLH